MCPKMNFTEAGLIPDLLMCENANVFFPIQHQNHEGNHDLNIKLRSELNQREREVSVYV